MTGPVIVAPSHLGSGLQTASRGVQAAAERLFRATVPLATGLRINRAADDPAGLIASEHLRAVFASLEAEAYTLRRTDAVATTAEGALAEAQALLGENAALEVQLANTAGLSAGEADALRAQLSSNQAAVATITSNAAFNGVPLFDGSTSLRAGGSVLALPGLAGEEPTAQGLADLRGQIGSFQKYAVGSRLRVVEESLESVATSHAVVRDADFAMAVAELVRARTMMEAGLAVVGMTQATVGSLMDIRG